MKLSEIKGERVFDVIADCIEPIANISSDPEASRLFTREAVPEGKDRDEFVSEKMMSSIPPLLKRHKKDIIAIMSSIEGVSAKKYAETLDMGKLFSDIIDLVSDEAFMSFFTSAQKKEEGDFSGSVQENTEGH